MIVPNVGGDSLSSAANQWQNLKNWLGTNYQVHLQLLNPPASEENLQQAEEELGYSIPSTLGDLIRLNNGETIQSDGIFGARRLMSIFEQVLVYRELSEDDRFPKKVIHPFLVSGGGDYYCIDLATGKVVEWWNEGGINGEISASLSDFLKAFNEALNKGNYVFVEGFSGLVDKNDL